MTQLAKNAPDGQLELFKEFQLGAQHLSRILPAWDLLFPFLFSKTKTLPPETRVDQIPTATHSFATPTGIVKISVSPALMSARAKSPSKMVYAGEREELVAATLRALFTRGEIEAIVEQVPAARPGETNSMIVLAFYIRQVRAELARTGHSFSHAEIDAALEVLAKTLFSLERIPEEGEPEVAPSIPYYHRYLKKGDKRVIYLNDIEASQIISGAYRSINSDLMLRLRSGLARWIYRYIHSEHRNAQKPEDTRLPPPCDISYSLLTERGVLQKTKTMISALPRVRDALAQLADLGVLHTSAAAPKGFIEQQITEPTGGRRRITDVIWHVYLSALDVQQIITENAEAKFRKPEFRYQRPSWRVSQTEAARRELRTDLLPLPRAPNPASLLPARLFVKK